MLQCFEIFRKQLDEIMIKAYHIIWLWKNRTLFGMVRGLLSQY